MKDSKRIIKQWEALTEQLTKQFCDKYNFDYGQGFWMRDVIGETFCTDDDFYFIDFRDIITDLKYDTKGEFKNWYNYDYDLSYLGVQPCISYLSWLKGAPRPFTQEQIRDMYQMTDTDREKFAKVFYEQNKRNRQRQDEQEH